MGQHEERVLDHKSDRQYLYQHNQKISCPVLEKSARSRKVYLPTDADWYDFDTNQFLAGGQWINAEAPLTAIPLYVRAGSILPLGPVKQYVSQESDRPLALYVYPGADDNFTFYDDSGDGYGYERGEYGMLHLC